MMCKVIYWLNSNQGVLAFIGLLFFVLALFLGKKIYAKIYLSQKSGKNSKNYQSGGNMNIKR